MQHNAGRFGSLPRNILCVACRQLPKCFLDNFQACRHVEQLLDVLFAEKQHVRQRLRRLLCKQIGDFANRLSSLLGNASIPKSTGYASRGSLLENANFL
jgi:hypothetical protein